MENESAKRRDWNFFALSALFLSVLIISALVFSLAGFFYGELIWGAALAAGAGALFVWKKRKGASFLILAPSWQTASVLFFALLAAIYIGKTSEPTVFTGRDQGSLATAAISLAENHKLTERSTVSDKFFAIYGPGKALNFPGYYYTKSGELITQFPLPYVIYLALFYSVLGIKGLAFANGALLMLSALAFFLAVRSFLGARYALLALAFLFSLLPFSWFFKFTLTETLAFALLWSAVALAAAILSGGARKLTSWALLAAIAALALTRIEGAAFGAMLLFAVFRKKENRAFLKSEMGRPLFVLAPLALIFLLFYVAADIHFFREVLKGFLNSWTSSGNSGASNIFRSSLMEPAAYISQVYVRYGMMAFFVLGSLGIISALCKRKVYLLLPVFAVAPAFIYFIDSHISSDHPWMLRRFMFALLPAFVYASAMLLWLWERRHGRHVLSRPFTALIATLLILQSLGATAKLLPHTENKNLLRQTGDLAQKFSPNDLVLVDRDASGDGWSMLSGPLKEIYGLSAAYFFNSSDLAKLDTSSFEKIYLIAPKTAAARWKALLGDRIASEQPYSLETSRLQIDPGAQKKITVTIPRSHTEKTDGYIFEIRK